MTLHLARLAVAPRALATFAVANGASDDDGGYALHLALRRRFGEAGPQPFRLLEDADRPSFLLGYVGDPATLSDAAALPATDPVLDAVFPDPPQLRPMPDSWRAGARYGFEVRARPVVRFGGRVREARAGRPGAWQNRAGEVDAFVAACERATPVADGGEPVLREAVYGRWLTERLAPAATVDDVELRQVRRVRTRRSTHGRAGAGRVEGPDAVLGGMLTVTDPDAFARALARGVGRHAAFGFGMLLLSPPRRGG